MIDIPSWQKSSYCAEGNNCIEIAVDPVPGTRLMRESTRPDQVLAMTPGSLSALLRTLRRSTGPA